MSLYALEVQLQAGLLMHWKDSRKHECLCFNGALASCVFYALEIKSPAWTVKHLRYSRILILWAQLEGWGRG